MILGSRVFSIGVVRLEECLYLLDSVISGIEDMLIRCRSAEDVIQSSVLNILLDVFHLEVHCLRI